MNSSKQIKFGALLSYFAIAFNIVAGLLYTPWMISKIGQSNYGLYTVAGSLITMFVIDFGMSAAVSRFISIYNAKGEQEKANNFIGLVYKLYFALDTIILIAVVVTYIFIEKIYVNFSHEEIHTLKGLFIIVAIYNLVQFPFTNLNGILTAYEKFVQLKACDLLHKVMIIAFVVVALLSGAGVTALVVANAVSGLLTIVFKLIIIRKKTPLKANFKFFDKIVLKDIFGFSAWTTVSTLAQRLIFNITPTIIAAFSVTGSIGAAVFGLASTIEGYVYTFATAINGMFMPRISKIIVSGQKDKELMKLMIKIGRIQFLIVGLIVCGFAALGKPFIIDIWHKGDFIDSYYCVLFLIIPSLFYLPMQIANTTIIVENKVKLQAIVFVIMGMINVALSIPLSKYFGAIGASAAIFIAYTVRNILMVIIHIKVLHLNMFKFFKDVYLKLAPFLAVVLITGMLCYKFNPISNAYISFMTNGIVMVLVFGTVTYFLGLNSYEKNLIFGFVKKLTKKLHLAK